MLGVLEALGRPGVARITYFEFSRSIFEEHPCNATPCSSGTGAAEAETSLVTHENDENDGDEDEEEGSGSDDDADDPARPKDTEAIATLKKEHEAQVQKLRDEIEELKKDVAESVSDALYGHEPRALRNWIASVHKECALATLPSVPPLRRDRDQMLLCT